MGIRQAVLGCGRWGSFHLWYGSRIGNGVTGWEPEGSPGITRLLETGGNRYLELPAEVELTVDLEDIQDSDIVVVAVPAQNFRSLCGVLSKLNMGKSDIVLCMKGIEKGTGMRLSQVALEEGLEPRSISIWVGPGHPQQFLEGVPSCMIVASNREEDTLRLTDVFSSDLIRFYRSRDLTGCEVGAATKNVVGIAAGVLDGLNMSGLKGALMARAPQEMARLVSAMGGDWRSVYGLSHLGDYEATLFSRYSHNRMYGEAVARGAVTDESFLAEGVDTAEAVISLAERHHVEMPITCTVRQVLRGCLSAEDAIAQLFSRPLKEEFPGRF